MTSETIEQSVKMIIGCAIEVHRVLGPGLLESIYQECLLIELRAAGLLVECGRRVVLQYKGQKLTSFLKVDLIVENSVVVELKAVDQIHPIHKAQVITYLKLTGCPVGLLLDFNSTSLRQGMHRLDHPEHYRPTTEKRF
jgi:GxxExxY protein